MDITGDVDYDDLAVQLDSYSGADITNLCRDAAMMSMRRAIKVRSMMMRDLQGDSGGRIPWLRFGMFHHPAWAVSSYSSGPPAGGTSQI